MPGRRELRAPSPARGVQEADRGGSVPTSCFSLLSIYIYMSVCIFSKKKKSLRIYLKKIGKLPNFPPFLAHNS